jgi:hypothetical protein
MNLDGGKAGEEAEIIFVTRRLPDAAEREAKERVVVERLKRLRRVQPQLEMRGAEEFMGHPSGDGLRRVSHLSLPLEYPPISGSRDCF